MNQNSSLSEGPQFVSRVMTANSVAESGTLPKERCGQRIQVMAKQIKRRNNAVEFIDVTVVLLPLIS